MENNNNENGFQILTRWLRKDFRDRRIVIECSKDTPAIIFAFQQKRDEQGRWTQTMPSYSLNQVDDALLALACHNENLMKGKATAVPPTDETKQKED